MPYVIQELNSLCGFNFTLIFWKHSLHKERKILRNLLYASLTFCKILILFQSILRNFCLNSSIDWSEILLLKMYCPVISASILFFVAKMIGKWSEVYVFTIAVLVSILSMVVFVNTWSIAVAVCLMTRVRLCIVDVMEIVVFMDLLVFQI